MTDGGADSQVFEQIIRELLSQGLSVRFQARGASMSPAICDGETVEVTPVMVRKLRKDDIVLAKSNLGFRLHRIVRADHDNRVFITRGDCGQQDDPPLSSEQILGIARAKEVRIGKNKVRANFRGIGGWALRCAARGQSIAGKLAIRIAAAKRTGVSQNRRSIPFLAILLCAAVIVPLCRAQVAVDYTTSAAQELSSGHTAGTRTITLTHNTTSTANRLLIVGVSINITNSAAAAVSSVTYNGTGLTQLGSHNDAGNTRRVEMWYLKAPVSGT